MPLRPVREIMSAATVRCAPDTSVRDACSRMAAGRCGHVLVCEGDRLVGIFTERDLSTRVVAPGHDPAAYPVEKAMTVNPVTIEASAPIREAIRVMDEGSFRCLPVVEGGKLVGVLTARDLPYEEVGRMARELEEEHVIAERLW